MPKRSKINSEILRLFAQGDKFDDKTLARLESDLVKVYRASFRNIDSIIGGIFSKHGDDVTYADMLKFKRLANIEKQIGEELQRLTNENVTTMRMGISDFYTRNYYYTLFATERTLQTKLNFGLLRKEDIQAAVVNPLDRIGWPERYRGQVDMLNNRVKQALAQGLIQGDGYKSIADSILDIGGKSGFQALRIIRTEGQRARSAGRVSGFEKSEKAAEELGITPVREWVATLDSRTRDMHRGIDGQHADEDGLFYFSDGTSTPGPGMSGVAKHDINCRCTTIMQFEEIPQTVRQDNIDKTSIPYQTYEEWEKNRVKPKAA